MTVQGPEGPWGADESSPMDEGSENTAVGSVSPGDRPVPPDAPPDTDRDEEERDRPNWSDLEESPTPPRNAGHGRTPGTGDARTPGAPGPVTGGSPPPSSGQPGDPSQAGPDSVDLPDESLGR